MMRRRVAVIVAILLAAGVGAALFVSLARGLGRRSGAIPHDVYVWQRAWTEDVSSSVGRAADLAHGFAVLVAEVSWQDGRAEAVRVRPDYQALKASGRPVGLAVRIGPYGGPFERGSEATKVVVQVARSAIEEARAAGLEPAELQVDFDCAESKLDGYREWVEALRAESGDTPVVITALPSWLRHRAFGALARAADGFVLQVHSLDPPAGPEAPMLLCDPEKARRWVEEAARVGAPFRVALPTYGNLIGISAEGPPRAWGPGTAARAVRADAPAMARLVRRWEHDRPARLQGVIWYRLPVEGDNLNWKWQTLAAIVAGDPLREELRAEVEHPDPELLDIVLVNEGNVDLPARGEVEVEWEKGRLVAGDGLRGWRLETAGAGGIELRRDGSAELDVLAPGERWRIGWLRFDEQTEVTVHVSAPHE
jgi:hypothetical protein